MTQVMGLDLSLTKSGVVTEQEVGSIKGGTRRGPARLAYVRDEVLARVVRDRVDAVFVEGYSYHSQGTAVYGIGELGGVIRLALWENSIPYVEVAPAILKKYATGKGNASKEDVLIAAIKRAPSDILIRGNDEADAFWLYALGWDLLGGPIIPMPAIHRDALAKLTWPPVAA